MHTALYIVIWNRNYTVHLVCTHLILSLSKGHFFNLTKPKNRAVTEMVASIFNPMILNEEYLSESITPSVWASRHKCHFYNVQSTTFTYCKCTCLDCIYMCSSMYMYIALWHCHIGACCGNTSVSTLSLITHIMQFTCRSKSQYLLPINIIFREPD